MISLNRTMGSSGQGCSLKKDGVTEVFFFFKGKERKENLRHFNMLNTHSIINSKDFYTSI